jgi:hypothetical protein
MLRKVDWYVLTSQFNLSALPSSDGTHMLSLDAGDKLRVPIYAANIPEDRISHLHRSGTHL